MKSPELLQKVFISCLLIVMLVVTGWPIMAHAKTTKIPFATGEKLEFELRWTFVKAGKAVMEIKPHAMLDGKPAWHFVLTAESNSFVDAFYKVRDRIDAYTDAQLNHSVLYKKKQLEGDTHRDIVVDFNLRKQTAQYTNFAKKRKPIAIMPGTFDPLSAFYFIRGFDMEEGSTIKRPITDGKKCIIGKLKVVKRETIKVKDKKYDTWLIEPELEHVGGVFEKSKNAKLQLWITNDARRIPVRIKSKVVVGSFVGDLVSATPGEKSGNQVSFHDSREKAR